MRMWNLKRAALACVVMLAAAPPAFARVLEPPVVLDGSVQFAVLPTAYAEVASALSVTAGSEVRMTLSASRDLASATLTFAGPQTIVVAGRVAGSQASFALVVARTLAPGSYSASVRLLDLAGRARELTLPLPAPGFVVEERVASPCALLDSLGSPVCSDIDADGRAGNSAACTAMPDCDDTNPTVHPRAPELPGDGLDNDCSGNGDAAVDETVGVFLDKGGLAGTRTGTKRRPFRRLSEAVALAHATGRMVFAATGTYSGSGIPPTIPVTVIGGFDRRSWTRPAFARSLVSAATTLTVSGPLLAGLDIELVSGAELRVTASPVTALVDVGVTGGSEREVKTAGEVRFVRVQIAGPRLRVDAGTLVVIHGELACIAQANGTALQLNRTTVSGALDSAGALSISRGFHQASITNDGGVLRVFSTTLRPAAGPAIDQRAGVVTLYNSVIVSTGTGLAHTADTIVRAESDLFDVPCPIAMDGACTATTCAVGGNVCASASLEGAGDFHLGAGSPAVDRGMRYHPDKTPSSSAVDIDGHCLSGELDLGADEAQ